MNKDLLQIIQHFGIRNQLKKLNEECYELSEAVRDYCKCDKSDEFEEEYHLEHIKEEFSDVMVLLSQIGLYYNINPEEIDEIGKQKIERTLERIKNGYYNKGEK